MYTGNRIGGVVGKFPYPPYSWWLSGAAWGGMIDYWHYTGDESYYNVTYDALVAQISATHDYLPLAEKFDEVGNTVLRE
jgi:mannan endo-1,6-alpha-mannosidase